MDVKFGKIISGSNNFENLSINNSDENFFASVNNSNPNTLRHESSSGTRINDYDSNILEDNAYQVLPDEIFKLEHKINNLEKTLSQINTEILALEGFGDDIQIFELKNRKQKVEQELTELNKKYSSLGLGSKISSQIASVVNLTSGKLASQSKNSLMKKTLDFVSKKVLAKLSKKIGYKISMKEALENLSNINSSVDELIKMQAPYGENIDRYDKLIAYLNRANLIHSQISRNMKTFQ